MKNRIRNLVTFHSGMIGDFLFLLNLADNAHAYDTSIETKIFVTRNASFFTEIVAKHYPFVHIIPLKQEGVSSKHYRYNALKDIWKGAISRNAFVIIKFFKADSLKTLIFGWLLTRIPGSRFISFGDSRVLLKKILCTDICPFDLKKSTFDNLLSETDRLGWKRIVSRPVFRYTPDKNSLLPYHLDTAPFIVIHITPTRRRRTFPIPRWKKVIDQTLSFIPEATIILTGSKDDFNFVQELASLCANNKVQNYAGTFTPTELLSVIHYSKLYIGVETGITHLTSMMGHASLIIGHSEAPTALPTYAPNTIVLRNKEKCVCVGDNTFTCVAEENGKQYTRCTLYITDEMVLEGLEKLLSPHTI